MIGSVISFLLIPVIFWPPKRRRFSASTNPPQSIYDTLGYPAWIGWVFVGVVIVSILISCLRTRVIFSTSGKDEMNASRFNGFENKHAKPLKRFSWFYALLHRAKATVLMKPAVPSRFGGGVCCARGRAHSKVHPCQSQSIPDHDQIRQTHRCRAQDRTHETHRCERNCRCVVEERPEQILFDRPQRRSRQRQRLRHSFDV